MNNAARTNEHSQLSREDLIRFSNASCEYYRQDPSTQISANGVEAEEAAEMQRCLGKYIGHTDNKISSHARVLDYAIQSWNRDGSRTHGAWANIIEKDKTLRLLVYDHEKSTSNDPHLPEYSPEVSSPSDHTEGRPHGRRASPRGTYHSLHGTCPPGSGGSASAPSLPVMEGKIIVRGLYYSNYNWTTDGLQELVSQTCDDGSEVMVTLATKAEIATDAHTGEGRMTEHSVEQ